jgi:hypothetical protein
MPTIRMEIFLPSQAARNRTPEETPGNRTCGLATGVHGDAV